jgi:hypothetical protein
LSRKPWNPRKWLDAHGKRARVCFVDGSKDKDLEFGKLGGCSLHTAGGRPEWVIKIDTNESEANQRLWFLHELMHVADDVAGDLMTEEMIRVESQILFDILDANPGVATWIGGKK